MYSLIFMYYNYIETRVCKCFLGASPHRCSYALRAVCRGCSMFQSLEAARDFDFRTYSHIFSNIFPVFLFFLDTLCLRSLRDSSSLQSCMMLQSPVKLFSLFKACATNTRARSDRATDTPRNLYSTCVQHSQVSKLM